MKPAPAGSSRMSRAAAWLWRGVWISPGLLAGVAAAATITVGPDGQVPTLARALRLARDGDTVLVSSGTYRGDVAVLTQKKLTIRGLGQRPVLSADGQHAEGKAILVVRDGDIVIENLEFRGARVPDGNGAGIRFEKGSLTLRGCAFFDNQNGVLTANFGDAQLAIADSEFAQAPRVEGALHHLLYVGRIASLKVSGSRFRQGHVGHLLKSRARRTELAYNLMVDGEGGRASYEVDLPNGGDALLIGNVIGQSATTENAVLVSYGAEGHAWPGSRLRVAHNTLVSDGVKPGWFVRVWSDKLPADTPVQAVNNLGVGLGVFMLGGAGETAGNFTVVRAQLTGADTLDFALGAGSALRGRGVDPRSVFGGELVPRAEFTLPIGTRPLQAPPSWSPGALQR